MKKKTSDRSKGSKKLLREASFAAKAVASVPKSRSSLSGISSFPSSEFRDNFQSTGYMRHHPIMDLRTNTFDFNPRIQTDPSGVKILNTNSSSTIGLGMS